MKQYITGDTHFNHTPAMLEYCNRPENFESRIFKHLMALGEDTILYHLGDVCIGRDAEMHERYIAPLKARKILIRGNHDKKSNTWYLAHGWDFVCLAIADNLFGKKILLTHRPAAESLNYDINIHAHLHNLGHRDGEYLLVKNDKQSLYSCEDYNYMPVPLRNLIEVKKP
jgi:calcineurin-like phosphoesterase family protein